MTTTLKLQDFIDMGDFDYVNPNIVPLFKDEPLRGGAVEIRQFNRTITSEEVISELAKDGCVPATATELFAWHSENKSKLKKYESVIALGSVKEFEGDRRVCSAWLYDSERNAGLYWFDYEWDAYDWFAFSRESTQTLKSKSSALSPLDLISEIESKLAELKKLV